MKLYIMSEPQNDKLIRKIKEKCRGQLRINESLSKHTTFGLGGPADLFFLPADLEDLATVVPILKDANLPILPLGGGTNTLVRDAGFRGVVLCLTAGAHNIAVSENLVQAGASTQVFSRQCQRAGKTGFEFGCGIPGTIGGAIRGNAGAWGGETFDNLISIRGLNLKTGNDEAYKKADITFAYRRTSLSPDFLIVDATFQLDEGNPETIQETMAQMLSERKTSQPLSNRSPGCIFKNPPGTSAGLLIDQAGCKGLSVGAVQVSDVHANFMINLGGTSADDVLSLIDQVTQRVQKVHNITLEPEVRIIGEYGIENKTLETAS
ncbi:MAG: UDP-N-acetylmuramate dehydrogenase [Candidatus Latescibacterota bacterium]